MKPLRSLPRIAARIYAEPWLIREAKHESIRSQFRAALIDRNEGHRLGYYADDQPEIVAEKMADMDCLACLEIEAGIAIVPVTGILGKHLDLMETMCGGFDLDTLNAQCLALMNRADVHTVVFHFNTPGGAAAGVADSAQCMLDLAASGRKLVAYCDEACSGGMWLAAACDEIFCGQSAMLGSISAICAILDESKAFEMEGLAMQVFTDGTLKGAGIEGTTLTPAQRTDIQSRVEHIGGMFKSFMRSRRPGVSADIMQGQWFYGDQALTLGLADGLHSTLAHCIASLM